MTSGRITLCLTPPPRASAGGDRDPPSPAPRWSAAFETFGLIFFGTILLSFPLGLLAAFAPVRLAYAWALGAAPGVVLVWAWCLTGSYGLFTYGPGEGGSAGNGPDTLTQLWTLGGEWLIAVLVFALAGVLLVRGSAAVIRALRS